MFFFRKKVKPPAPSKKEEKPEKKPIPTSPESLEHKVLTAEGWRRRAGLSPSKKS